MGKFTEGDMIADNGQYFWFGQKANNTKLLHCSQEIYNEFWNPRSGTMQQYT